MILPILGSTNGGNDKVISKLVNDDIMVKKIVYSVRLREDLIGALDELAEDCDVSRNEIIEDILLYTIGNEEILDEIFPEEESSEEEEEEEDSSSETEVQASEAE